MIINKVNRKRITMVGAMLIAGYIFYEIISWQTTQPLMDRNRLANADNTELKSSAKKEIELPEQVGESMQADNLDHQSLAPSLIGTEIDGSLEVDSEGNLLITHSVRDFFDYILNTIGDVTPEQAIEYIERYAGANLPPAAVQQTMDLLSNYLMFKDSARAMLDQPLLPRPQQTPAYYLETLESSLEKLAELRRHHLGAEAAQAFFGLEEAYSNYSLSKARIELSSEYDQEEKHQLLEQLRTDLPPFLKESLYNQQASLEREKRVNEIVSSSASLEEKRSALYEYHDVETAERIVDQLSEEETWAQKLAQYRIAKKAVCSAGWPAHELLQQLNQLKAQHFPSAQERSIAETYEAKFTRENKVSSGSPVACL